MTLLPDFTFLRIMERGESEGKPGALAALGGVRGRGAEGRVGCYRLLPGSGNSPTLLEVCHATWPRPQELSWNMLSECREFPPFLLT